MDNASPPVPMNVCLANEMKKILSKSNNTLNEKQESHGTEEKKDISLSSSPTIEDKINTNIEIRKGEINSETKNEEQNTTQSQVISEIQKEEINIETKLIAKEDKKDEIKIDEKSNSKSIAEPSPVCI